MKKTELPSTHDEAQVIDVEIEDRKQSPIKLTPLWIVCFILFLSIIGCASGAFWFYKSHYQPLANEVSSQRAMVKSVEHVAQTQNQVNSTIKQTQDAQNRLENQLKAELKKQLTANKEQVSRQLSQQQAQLNRIDADVSKLSGNRSSDWLVAEADYLSRMAGRKLWLEDDTQTAILLLKEADSRLEDAADPALIPVRKAIAQDIQRIAQVNPVSVTSIAISLSGLIGNIDNLPLSTLQLPDVVTPQAAEVSKDVGDWKDNLLAVLRSVADDFYKLDTRDTDVEPLMSEAQRFLIKEQLTLSLQQAQYAALHHEVKLFNESLNQAINSLESHFVLDSTQVTQAIETIEELRNTDIARSLPTTLKSNRLLKDTVSRRLPKVNQQDNKNIMETDITTGTVLP